MMKIVEKKTSDLIPYARNARQHPESQIAQIAASIRHFGFRNPVLIDGDNGIIAGHGRVEAARLLGLEKVPCIDCSDLSESDRRAYVLADNRIALSSSWDEQMLGLEVRDLANLEFDLSLLGFDQAELDEMINGLPDETPEDFAEVDESIETEHECPKCGYRFSGGKKTKASDHDDNEQ